jgi:hypothetical protein
MLHVHAEICQALLNRPSLRVDYEYFVLPALQDDVSWGNRIVWLSARILQWMERGMRTVEEWHALAQLVDEWECERPASFDAFFFQEHVGDAVGYFPELWFSGPCYGRFILLKDTFDGHS